MSYEKDKTKDSEAKQLLKPWPYRTEPGEIRYLKLGTVERSNKEADSMYSNQYNTTGEEVKFGNCS